MLTKANDNIVIKYNKLYDILYIKLKNCYDSYVEEKNRGILTNLDYRNNEIVGFDIWDFKSRIEKNEHIPLSIAIDFKKIYNSLK